MITIYGKSACPYCDAAKSLCQTLKKEYEYIDIFSSEEAEKKYSVLSEKHDHYTVPLILNGDTFIGGFTEFQKIRG